MPHLEPWQYAMLTALCLAYGFIKSAFGISGALITPLTVLFVPIKFGIALMGPISLWSDVVTLRNHWRRWDPRQAWLLVSTSLIGTLVGTYILARVSNAALKWIIGGIAVAYGVHTLWREWQRRRTGAGDAPGAPVHWSLGVLAGVVGGVISAISHSGGMVFTIYLMAMGLRKEAYIATLVMCFFAQNLVKVPLYMGAGILDWKGLLLSVAMVPVIWVGGQFGKQVVKRLSVNQFASIVGVLILAAGVVTLLR